MAYTAMIAIVGATWLPLLVIMSFVVVMKSSFLRY